jgi:agmatinase
VGWFDIEQEERILTGKTIADCGDIWFQHGESIDTIFQRIARVCDEIVSNNSLPVFIGGDHSITFPIVEQLQKSEPLVIIWFDAHNDYGEILPGAANNHKNVARRIMQLPNIIKMIQIGYRGYTVYEDITPQSTRRKIITTKKLRDQGLASILAEIPPAVPCYISIDIDVLDPIYAPATSTPVPNGLSVKELKDAICAVGANRKIKGFDLMEVNPEKDMGEVTSLLACDLILTTLSTALDDKTL